LRQRLDQTAPKFTPCFGPYVPIDADVSPFDNSGSRKEGVNCTYKLFDGYAPMLAYIGAEGYLQSMNIPKLRFIPIDILIPCGMVLANSKSWENRNEAEQKHMHLKKNPLILSWYKMLYRLRLYWNICREYNE
jgi:hypothetical protein